MEEVDQVRPRANQERPESEPRTTRRHPRGAQDNPNIEPHIIQRRST